MEYKTKTGRDRRQHPALSLCLRQVKVVVRMSWGSSGGAALGVMSRDVVESVEGYAANRRVVSVVVVEVEPAGQRQASFGL